MPRHRGLGSKARKWTKIRPGGQPPRPIQSAGRARFEAFVEPVRPNKGGVSTQEGTSLTLVSGNEGLRASSADFAFGGLAHGGCGLGRVCTEGAEGGGLGGHRGTICPCPSEMNGPQSKGHSNMRVEGENWCHGVDFGPKPVPRQCPDHVKKDVFSPFLRKMSAKLRRAAAIWRSACGGMTYESKSCLIPLEFVFFGAVQAPFRTLDAPPHALPTTR